MASDVLAQIGDWIVQNWAVLGGSVSIPVVIGFITRAIVNFFKNKKTIKLAVLGAIQEVKISTNTLSDMINVFKEDTNNKLQEFEDNVMKKIDSKYDELKEQRIELYNNVVAENEKIEIQAQEKIKQIDEQLDKLEKQVEEIPEPEEIPAVEMVEEKETETIINADDILR